MTKPIYVLNGPNLNLLGQREPEIYGHDTLDDIEERLRRQAVPAGYDVVLRQTNYEGGVVSDLHEARTDAAAVIINAGAYTHTSVAICDAIKMLTIPSIELHLTNVHKREAFRHHSYLSPVVTGVIAGFGAAGYEHALAAAIRLLADEA